MLSGGLPPARVTALAGAVGTGKTLLGLQFLLDGARRGETGMLLSLRETEAELVAKVRGFGQDLASPIRDGSIRLATYSPVDLAVDEVMHEVVEALERGGSSAVWWMASWRCWSRSRKSRGAARCCTCCRTNCAPAASRR
jgi:circadian clock protein KaiC